MWPPRRRSSHGVWRSDAAASAEEQPWRAEVDVGHVAVVAEQP
jgi:hypothetical protein